MRGVAFTASADQQLAFPHRFLDLNLASIGDDAVDIIHALCLSNSRLLTKTLNSDPIHLYCCGSWASLRIIRIVYTYLVTFINYFILTTFVKSRFHPTS